MLGTIINAIAIIFGGLIGSIFGNKISSKLTAAIMTVMALITAVIGIQGAVGTQNLLLLVVCMVLGTVIGTLIKLDDKINEWAIAFINEH